MSNTVFADCPKALQKYAYFPRILKKTGSISFLDPIITY